VTRAESILIVGSMAFDDLELPSINAKDVVGGSATYSAFAASTFAEIRVVAVVGTDFPDATLTALRARGIDTAGIERAEGRTFRWAGRYDADLVHRHHARHAAQRLRVVRPEDPRPTATRRSCSSATSTRPSSSRCSSR